MLGMYVTPEPCSYPVDLSIGPDCMTPPNLLKPFSAPVTIIVLQLSSEAVNFGSMKSGLDWCSDYLFLFFSWNSLASLPQAFVCECMLVIVSSWPEALELVIGVHFYGNWKPFVYVSIGLAVEY